MKAKSMVVVALTGLVAGATAGWAQGMDDGRPDPVAGRAVVSDDLRADGVKLRGDGSVDDSQPGRPGGGGFDDSPGVDDSINLSRERETVVLEDGTVIETEERVQQNPITGNIRTRTETETEFPDGSESRVRTTVITDEDGNVLSEFTRSREKPAREDRDDDDRRGRGGREDRPDRDDDDREDRPERVERDDDDRPERVERDDRDDRVERVERDDRDDRVERVERDDRDDRVERVERDDRDDPGERPDRDDRGDRDDRPERDDD